MTDGIRKLRKVQIGKETTAGTAVAATALLRVDGSTIEDAKDVTFPTEHIGLLVETDRNYIPALLAKLSIPDNPATFEQLPYVFEAGIKKIGSGATDTGGSGKIYAYSLPLTSAHTIQTYTIEGGDNVQAEEMEYSFVEAFKISGKPKEAITFSSEWQGRQVTQTTFTGAISVPTVEEILFGKSKLYIDNAGGIGGTLVSSTLLGFDLEVTTGLMPSFTGDGELYYNRVKQIGPAGTLKVTFEHNESGVSEKTAWGNKTARAIRLMIQGNALGTAGATYSTKALVIDCWGKWSKFDKIGDQDGNDIVTGTLTLGYNSSDAKICDITVVNELSSLT